MLKELDKGEGLTPEAVKELRQATDLALRATKHTKHHEGPRRSSGKHLKFVHARLLYSAPREVQWIEPLTMEPPR